ncbi:MAG: Mov34/MPN/PAD-1 family protein [Candidatus Helarchaeota archaeon]
MQVTINPMAFYNILEHSSRDLKKEVAGYLIGKLKKGKIQITNTDTAQQKATSTHVKLDDLEMIRIAEKLENRGFKEHIIGWYHSHPRMGAHFFSHTDVNTQRRYQQLFPHAIGIVIDPYKFVNSLKYSDIDCHIYHLKGEQLEKRKIQIDFRLRTGLERIYTHLNNINGNVQKFINGFENFIQNKLQGIVYPNYYGNIYRINYQATPYKVWAHLYTRNYGKIRKNNLIIKGFFRGLCKKIENKFRSIGLKCKATKDRYSNYYLAIINIEKAVFSEPLSDILKELYQNWESNILK